jgi:hypothetical protein
MPWLAAKGLLPGRGMPAGADGRLGASSGFLLSVATSVASGAAASDFLVALPGLGVSTAGASVVSTSAAAFAFVVFFGASTGLAFGNASRSFLATGGVIVDAPLFTNSPSSASFATASLESIPSSLAMSYTRGSAT